MVCYEPKCDNCLEWYYCRCGNKGEIRFAPKQEYDRVPLDKDKTKFWCMECHEPIVDIFNVVFDDDVGLFCSSECRDRFLGFFQKCHYCSFPLEHMICQYEKVDEDGLVNGRPPKIMKIECKCGATWTRETGWMRTIKQIVKCYTCNKEIKNKTICHPSPLYGGIFCSNECMVKATLHSTMRW